MTQEELDAMARQLAEEGPPDLSDVVKMAEKFDVPPQTVDDGRLMAGLCLLIDTAFTNLAEMKSDPQFEQLAKIGETAARQLLAAAIRSAYGLGRSSAELPGPFANARLN